MIRVKFFAQLRERVGTDSQQIPYRDGICIADVLANLRTHSDIMQQALTQPCLMACNQTIVDETHVLSDGDEVAFFPPVTGG
jgi:molybdopterin synthase sulfur carrier subunit